MSILHCIKNNNIKNYEYAEEHACPKLKFKNTLSTILRLKSLEK